MHYAFEKHWTHQSLDEALKQAERIGAKETYFIHMSHQIGLHKQVNQDLPPHTHLAFDGMTSEDVKKLSTDKNNRPLSAPLIYQGTDRGATA